MHVAISGTCRLSTLTSLQANKDAMPGFPGNISCMSKVLFRSSDNKQAGAEQGVTLCSTASLDRVLAVMHLVEHWEGPLSIVLYARTEQEESHSIGELASGFVNSFVATCRVKIPVASLTVATCVTDVV